MTTLFQPLGDRVLVEPIEPKELKIGKILVPDTAKQPSQEGLVRAVGPGRTFDNGVTVPLGIEVGQRVLFTKYGGTEVKVDGMECKLLQSHDVLGIIG